MVTTTMKIQYINVHSNIHIPLAHEELVFALNSKVSIL